MLTGKKCVLNKDADFNKIKKWVWQENESISFEYKVIEKDYYFKKKQD